MRLASLFAIPLLVIGCTSSGAGGNTGRAEGDAPSGMRSLPTDGSGQVFTTTLSGSRSARQLAQGLIRGMQEYLGGSAQLLQAISDPGDTRLQAAFSAQRDGTPLMGLILIEVEGDGGRAVVMLDERQAMAGSVDRLMRVASLGGPAGAAEADAPVEDRLTRTPLPDGSGHIDLGPGWVIRFADKGAVDIQGPVPGSGMSLGAVAPVPLTSYDPVEALRRGTEMLGQQAGKRIALTILDSRPMEWVQGGRAALIRYRAVTDGQSMDYFGLIGITPFEPGQVFLYTSYIQAPSRDFARHFPTAMRSWASWSINPAVFAQRLRAAAASMRETGELLKGGGSSSSSRAFDGVNEGWGQYIRGVATLEDGDRNRSEVDQRFAERVVQADPNGFRIVPTNELVP
ncbi:MAG: hypothetical protein IT355_01405 [Gemmatimonadaceae bacterium]|nr:hypothetical protein [Gemmatimonadaceae bacterium]